MKLEKLEIENFKNMMRFTLEPGGRNVSIYGDNATGKTSIFDSITFLLFGKDSRCQADFSIKPIDPATGEELHNLNHSVEGCFVTNEGLNSRRITLKRELVENWTKKRGSATAEFSGHNTNYWVDGVPSKKKEYDAVIAAICPENLFSLLCSPTAFSSLHWTKQRAALLEVCGDVSIETVIAADPDFSAIPALLGGKSVDDWKKITAGRRAEINRRLVEIPARIDELKKSEPEMTNSNSLLLVGQLTKLREQLAAKNTEVATVTAGGGAASLQERLYSEDNKLRDIKEAHERSVRASKQNLENELTAAKNAGTAAKSLLDAAERKITNISDDIRTVTESISVLGQQWRDAQDMVFVSGSCPTCGQDIPAEQAESARAAFNLERSKKIESISTLGFAQKERLAKLNAEMGETKGHHVIHQTAVAEANWSIIQLQESIRKIDTTTPAAEELPEYQEAKRERDAIQAELTAISAGNTGILEKLTAEGSAIQDQIKVAEADLAKIEQHHKTTDRITELGAEEKTLAGEYAKLEGQLNVIDRFTRAKVRMLDERINSRFEIVKFRMFEEQINGGLADTCVMTVDGVPYGDLNNAARIQGGLDIIRTLSGYHRFAPPVIIDNHESVVRIPDMGETQVISLFVSGADKALRVVVQ